MKVTRIRALRGPNLWSRTTCVEAVVQCSPEECNLNIRPEIEARIRNLFPEVGAFRPYPLHKPMSLANVLSQTTLSLQIRAGCPISFCRTMPTQEEGTYQVVVEYSEEAVGKQALDIAQQLITAAWNDEAFDVTPHIAALAELDEDIRLGPSTGCIVEAAKARGVPFRRLTEGSLVQFGWGAKQRRIQAAEMDTTGAIAESIAQDKELTKAMLLAAGVPVPEGRPVTSAEDAWLAAQEIGAPNVPVVVKPQDGNQGKGVTVNVSTREAVMAGYENARKFRDDVLVERYLVGSDYRVLIVGDKLIAAARREPPLVVGDGVSTITELVAKVNADPRRGTGHATPLTRIRLDDIAKARLAEQGLTIDAVPDKGRRVILRNNANLSTGGTATDVTDDVHPEVAARCIAAAQMIGLDICGVDVVCETVMRPLEEQRGGIVEVNAAPGLRMHTNPSYGKGRNVGEAVIQQMFPANENGRIPVIAVTGTNGKTTTVRLTTHLLKTAGQRVGMTDTNGVYVNGRQIDSGDCSGPRSARSVLMHPDVDAAVLESARGGMLREGLAFDRCQVAIVTNVGSGDHLGLNYITTVEDLAVLKRVIVLNVAETGTAVLNAADPAVVRMASTCPGGVTFFAQDRNLPALAAHLALGKRGVYVEHGDVVAQEGSFQVRLPLRNIPITRNGTIGFQVENVLACVAAAWGVNTPWEAIAKGLSTFVSDANAAPGRFNTFDYKGATVIADYGHNPDAINALAQAVQAMPAQRRSVVISGAGDRRDEDIVDQTKILGKVFDEVILYEDACQRGRSEGEVVALLRQGLVDAPQTSHIEEIKGEFIAIDRALARLEPGDLCLILVDQVEEALAHIQQRVTAG
ncbi:MAG: cyanophycin synthetase [Pseudomonadota bacterium]